MVMRDGQGGRRLVIKHANGAVSTINRKVNDPATLHLKIAAPGEVATACADPRASRAACPANALPRGDALAFRNSEAANAVALWTGKRFEIVWIAN